MFISDVLIGPEKNMVTVSLKILFWHLSAELEENHEKP
jgi:hypothetical protein